MRPISRVVWLFQVLAYCVLFFMNFDWKFLMVPVGSVSDDVFASLNGNELL